GLAKMKTGDTPGAIADYDAALRLDPNLTRAHMDRGAAWFDQKHYGKAIADLEGHGNAVIDAEVSRMLGIAYFNTGDKERARPHLDKALASGSRDKELLKLVGYTRFDQGDYKGTVEALSQA